MKTIRRFLCWLGLHDYALLSTPTMVGVAHQNCCRRCSHLGPRYVFFRSRATWSPSEPSPLPLPKRIAYQPDDDKIRGE